LGHSQADGADGGDREEQYGEAFRHCNDYALSAKVFQGKGDQEAVDPRFTDRRARRRTAPSFVRDDAQAGASHTWSKPESCCASNGPT
jgi:hypothetical protein